MTSNIFFPVNAKITPTAYVIQLILQLDSRQAFRTNAVPFMSNQSEAASVLCKPKEPISEYELKFLKSIS